MTDDIGDTLAAIKKAETQKVRDEAAREERSKCADLLDALADDAVNEKQRREKIVSQLRSLARMLRSVR